MKKIIQGLLLLLLFTSSTSSFAEEIKIAVIVPKPVGGSPKTGQTIKCVDYDDGYYKKGAPASGAHYQDNGNGTITDNATGLMWVKDPSLCGGLTYNSQNKWASAAGKPRIMTWADAITNCEALSYAGQNDWRLPNIKELQSIVNYGRFEPAIGESTYELPWENIPPTDFSHLPVPLINGYWSSTTWTNIIPSADYAWYVFFDYGTASSDYKTDITYPTGKYYVRPVRGGQ